MSWFRAVLVGLGVASIAVSTTCSITRADDAHAPPTGAWIGVTVERLNDAARGDDASGVLVSEVAAGGPAAHAGLKPGDVLLVVGSTTLRSPGDLEAAERRLTPDEPVSIVVARDDGRMMKVVNVTPDLDPATRQAMLVRGNPEAPVPTTPTASPSRQPRATRATEGAAPDETTSPPASAVAGDAEALSAPSTNDATPPASHASDTAAPKAHGDAARLGFEGHELDPDLAAALGMAGVRGVMVLGVQTGGVADRAGLRPGDVITQVGDADVAGVEDFGRAIGATSGAVVLHVHHQGVQRDVDLDAEAAAPPHEAGNASPDRGAESPEVAPKAADPAPEAAQPAPEAATDVAPDLATPSSPPAADAAPPPTAPPTGRAVEAPAHDPAVDESLQELRDEIRVLRAELVRLRGQVQELRGQ